MKKDHHRNYRERSREKRKLPNHERRSPNRDRIPRRETKFREDWAPRKTTTEINRNEVCPFLTRIFYAVNDQNQYSKESNLAKDREVRLYLWMNTNLKQLAELLRAHLPAIRTKQRFVMSKVVGEEGRLHKKVMGTVMIHKKGDASDERTLEEQGFNIGDFIDVSINYK